MKVDGLDVDVGVEGVLVDENRATCEVGHVEPTSKNVMIDIYSERVIFATFSPF